MKLLSTLIKRNIKLFFKDKGMFFTSLITPGILLILYATFLANVFEESFVSNLPSDANISSFVIKGLVGGQLMSSLLAVVCVTVSFCSNFLMVQDKANGTIKDFTISPVKSSKLSISYYVATIFSTLIICYSALVLSLIYVLIVGWYISFIDILFLVLDTTLLVLFGTALSSVINFFLSSQGQISAVGTVVSAGYGFICGAYMPISSFGSGLQKVLSFFPGTYGTSLLRIHSMRGALNEIENSGVGDQVMIGIKDSMDCNIYFFGNEVGIFTKYIVIIITIVILLLIYMFLNSSKRFNRQK